MTSTSTTTAASKPASPPKDRGPDDARAQLARALRTRQRRAGRRRWYTVALSFALFAAAAWLALGTDVLQRVASREGSVTASAAAPDDHRTGVIVLQTGTDRCEKKQFDNDTGRVLDSAAPCGGSVVLDAHGMPVPIGTIHRLDAISKSFSGN